MRQHRGDRFAEPSDSSAGHVLRSLVARLPRPPRSFSAESSPRDGPPPSPRLSATVAPRVGAATSPRNRPRIARAKPMKRADDRAAKAYNSPDALWTNLSQLSLARGFGRGGEKGTVVKTSFWGRSPMRRGIIGGRFSSRPAPAVQHCNLSSHSLI